MALFEGYEGLLSVAVVDVHFYRLLLFRLLTKRENVTGRLRMRSEKNAGSKHHILLHCTCKKLADFLAPSSFYCCSLELKYGE